MYNKEKERNFLGILIIMDIIIIIVIYKNVNKKLFPTNGPVAKLIL